MTRKQRRLALIGSGLGVLAVAVALVHPANQLSDRAAWPVSAVRVIAAGNARSLSTISSAIIAPRATSE